MLKTLPSASSTGHSFSCRPEQRADGSARVFKSTHKRYRATRTPIPHANPPTHPHPPSVTPARAITKVRRIPRANKNTYASIAKFYNMISAYIVQKQRATGKQQAKAELHQEIERTRQRKKDLVSECDRWAKEYNVAYAQSEDTTYQDQDTLPPPDRMATLNRCYSEFHTSIIGVADAERDERSLSVNMQSITGEYETYKRQRVVTESRMHKHFMKLMHTVGKDTAYYMYKLFHSQATREIDVKTMVREKVETAEEKHHCPICASHSYDCMLTCCHHVVCAACAEHVSSSTDPKCPFCRTAITEEHIVNFVL